MVVVEVSKPAAPFGVPVESKISVLSGVIGIAKLARFKRLNISALNCTLKDSENLRMWVFLMTDRSRLDRPGPVKILRPALPPRLKHCGEVPSEGSQFAS